MLAYELICLVDQIHDFAANQHRKFVIKHLERWLIHSEEHDPLVHQTDDISDLADPEWLEIKEAWKEVRNAKAARTRLRNRLKISDNALNRHSKTPRKAKMTKVSSKVQIQNGRTRGHQPKTVNDSEPKRPRGRPRKSAKTPGSPPSRTATRKPRNRA